MSTSLEIWVTFVAEYVVMLKLGPEEGGFSGSTTLDRTNWSDWRNWISVAIIVLSFPLLAPIFQFVRLVRVVRLARLGRVVVVAGAWARRSDVEGCCTWALWSQPPSSLAVC